MGLCKKTEHGTVPQNRCGDHEICFRMSGGCNCVRISGNAGENIRKKETKAVRLYQMGDSTIEARRDLLQEQYEVLEEQRRQINATMERLKYKISRYQKAVETGVLSWEKEEEN